MEFEARNPFKLWTSSYTVGLEFSETCDVTTSGGLLYKITTLRSTELFAEDLAANGVREDASEFAEGRSKQSSSTRYVRCRAIIS